ncbi:MAG: hypothetical protein Kow0010_18010 [Dehalococcoidia bacterium]
MMALGFGTFIALVAVLGLPLLLRDPWFALPFVVVPAVGMAWLARRGATPELSRWQRGALIAEAALVFAVAAVLALVGVLGG